MEPEEPIIKTTQSTLDLYNEAANTPGILPLRSEVEF
jgi:hypothetical protein